MAYKRTYTQKESGDDKTTQLSLELDSKKAVTVSLFKGIPLVDIREYYTDASTKERKPGKKGIALTVETWKKLLELQNEINEALDSLQNKKQKVEKNEEIEKAEKDVEEPKAIKEEQE